MHEPQLTPQHPRPCSTPHSAPAAWLKYDPQITPPAEASSEPVPAEPLTPEQQREAEIAAFLEAYRRIAPEAERRDGWSPFLRKLFLQVVAETGRVTFACECTGLSRTAAYALAARDPVFSAGWDAAAMLARRPIDDIITEQALEGVVETVTRADGATITRRRFDSRLSIAVLNRLDKRCDRAEEMGSKHLAIVRNWDEWLDHIGKGEDEAAQALIEPVEDRTSCKLPESENPTRDIPGYDPWENVWRNDDGVWMTTFAPPPGFEGHENRPWDGFNRYERTCTAEEAELLDANQAAAEAEELAEDIALAKEEREEFFGALRREVYRFAELRHSRESGDLAKNQELGSRFRGNDELAYGRPEAPQGGGTCGTQSARS
jgi:hypothetical protein